MLRGDIDLLVWGLLSAPHAWFTTTSLSVPVYLWFIIETLPFNVKPYCFVLFCSFPPWVCGLVVSMYLFLHFSLSPSVVGGIGIPCGERIDGLWVSAWVCTDSDLMDTAVHNVVYWGNEHCGHISLVFSLSPCHTQSVALSYPRVSTFKSS